MTSKRQRGEALSSNPPATYDKKKFVSEETSERFHTIMVIKSLIPERGILPHERDDAHVARMIVERGWQTLTAQPEPAIVDIVREFYANAIKAKDHEVMVRGKRVPFSRKSIDEYYNLPRMHGDDDLVKYKSKHLDWDEVISTLCRPGARWTMKDGRHAHFRQSDLSRYSKAWLYFICAKLWPSTHVIEVIPARALILFALVTSRSINVGRVIRDSILFTIRGKSAGGLPHPSLICGLCLKAKVAWGAHELRQPPLTPIDSRAISHYKVWGGGQSEPHGAGFTTFEESNEIDEPVGSPAPRIEAPEASISSMDVVIAKMRELHRENQELRAEVQREAHERRKDSRRQYRRLSHTMQ